MQQHGAVIRFVSVVERQTAVGTGTDRQSMRVQGMWPYWLDGHAPTTVKNSFHMSSMYLLTGMIPVTPSTASSCKAHLISNDLSQLT